MKNQVVNILLVEDNPADVRLTQEAFKECRQKVNIQVVDDGEKALAYVKKQGLFKDAPVPHMILLDLNLPKKNGYEVLQEIKEDPKLKKIPVAILTTSQAEEDIARTYNLHANCYLRKPVELDQFTRMIQSLEQFWFDFAQILDLDK